MNEEQEGSDLEEDDSSEEQKYDFDFKSMHLEKLNMFTVVGIVPQPKNLEEHSKLLLFVWHRWDRKLNDFKLVAQRDIEFNKHQSPDDQPVKLGEFEMGFSSKLLWFKARPSVCGMLQFTSRFCYKMYFAYKDRIVLCKQGNYLGLKQGYELLHKTHAIEDYDATQKSGHFFITYHKRPSENSSSNDDADLRCKQQLFFKLVL